MADVVAFDRAAFEAGIRLAMGVGLAPDEGNQPLFVFADDVTPAGSYDSEEVAFDPTLRPTVAPGQTLRVACAVEYVDAKGQAVDFGSMAVTQLRLTFLDAEYQQIKGFDHVVIDGDRYFPRRTAPPIGMVTSTVWQVVCEAEDET